VNRCSRRAAQQPAAAGCRGLTLVLQLATVYVPWLQPIFHTQALSAGELGLCLALAAVVFGVVEIEKAWRRRGQRI
jgi:Ca2+-transporting ATPase